MKFSKDLLYLVLFAFCIFLLLVLLNKCKFREGLEDGDGEWKDGLSVTHYYDCGGQSCDAPLLQPWNDSKFVAGPGYTVLDPNDFGGAKYGEKMWIYGAASDVLANMLGDNVDGLGKVTEGDATGGCGKSILIKNPDAKNSDWTALVMRKSRCPPWSSGCDKPHMDLMIPGFDNLQYSTANRCGDPGTGMTKEESAICGADGNPSACSKCDSLPENFRKGCQLFVDWGWTRGDPTCQYKVVETPEEFIAYTKKIQIGGSNADSGVTPSPSPKPEPGPSPTPKPGPGPSPSPAPGPDPKPQPGPKPPPGPDPPPKPEPGPSPTPKPHPGPTPSPAPVPHQQHGGNQPHPVPTHDGGHNPHTGNFRQHPWLASPFPPPKM